jgi:hypothetical protein
MTLFPPTRRDDFERHKAASQSNLGVVAALPLVFPAWDGLLV